MDVTADKIIKKKLIPDNEITGIPLKLQTNLVNTSESDLSLFIYFKNSFFLHKNKIQTTLRSKNKVMSIKIFLKLSLPR